MVAKQRLHLVTDEAATYKTRRKASKVSASASKISTAPAAPAAPAKTSARPSRGRPPRQGKSATEQIAFRLTQHQAQLLRELGQGQASEGLRWLLTDYEARRAAPDPSPAPILHPNNPPPAPTGGIVHPIIPPYQPTPFTRPPKSASPREDDLYQTVRAVPKSYSMRDATPPKKGNTPTAAPSTDPADQGVEPWW